MRWTEDYYSEYYVREKIQEDIGGEIESAHKRAQII